MENANGAQIPHTVTKDEKYWDEKYEMGRKLGEGSFGVVYEVVNRETGEHCACKIINKDKVSPDFVDYVVCTIRDNLDDEWIA